jgi:putative NADH-flavin reductase
MKIVVFGPTGMIGSRIVTELEQRGHEVIGVSRATGADITDPDSVATAAAGADAVVSAVAARGVDYTLTDVARSAVDGLRRADVKRLVIVGGAGSLEVAPGVKLIDTPEFPAAYRPEAAKGGEFLDLLRGENELEWTFLSPSAMVGPGERTGKFRLGGDQLLTNDKGSSISWQDYAIAAVDELEKPAHVRQRFTVGY